MVVKVVVQVKVLKAAGLPPLQAAKAAGAPPLLAAKAAGAPPLLAAKAAGLPPLLAAKAAGLPPLLAAKAAGLPPLLAAKAAGLPPLLAAKAAGLPPLLAAKAEWLEIPMHSKALAVAVSLEFIMNSRPFLLYCLQDYKNHNKPTKYSDVTLSSLYYRALVNFTKSLRYGPQLEDIYSEEFQDISDAVVDTFTHRNITVFCFCCLFLVYYRALVNFTKSLRYGPQLEDIYSEEFQDISDAVVDTLESEYSKIPGNQDVSVVLIKLIDGYEFVELDVGSDFNTNDALIRSVLYSVVEEGSIGSYSTSVEGFQFRRLGVVIPRPRPCMSDEFACGDGECILLEYRCDNRADCRDMSDETGCDLQTLAPPVKTAPPVIPTTTVRPVITPRPLPPHTTPRNGLPGPLKPSPSRPCRVDEAVCQSGQCILRDYLCDGERDCGDGSDELSCGTPSPCEPNEFKCRNGRCALKLWRCDGDNDCGDNSDEEYCPTKGPGDTCAPDQFICVTDRVCIPASYQCDEEADCSDRSDEYGCTPPQVTSPPEETITAVRGETVTFSCSAVGVPTPIITWRLNWGHIPASARITMSSKNGQGTLVIRDVKDADQGAYTCEAINAKGMVFGIPDGVLMIEQGRCYRAVQGYKAKSIFKYSKVYSPCPGGHFSIESNSRCVSCFCFGITKSCQSTRRYRNQIRLRFTEEDDFKGPCPGGHFSIESNSRCVSCFCFGITKSCQSTRRYRNQIRLRFTEEDDFKGVNVSLPSKPASPPLTSSQILINPEMEEFQLLDLSRRFLNLESFWTLPNQFLGNKIDSYGGTLKYKVRYTLARGQTEPEDRPDVVIMGNGQKLIYRRRKPTPPNVVNQQEIQFTEENWEHESGAPVSRGDLMMTLVNLEGINIRTVYDNKMVSVGLSDIVMDTTTVEYTNQGPALSVEECRCPPGYTGLSCESCAADFERVSGGAFLGSCAGCNCNGHASTCDPVGGRCLSCQHNTEGPQCDKCQPGFFGDPTRGRPDDCKPCPCPYTETTRRPSYSISVPHYQPNVVGTLCDECKTGFFHLKQDNPDGCLQCFCMGVTKQCASSSWNREQVRAADNGQEFTLSNSANTRTISEGIILQSSSELTFRSFSEHPTDVYYWVLPERFRGDKVTSYGGELQYTVLYNPRPGSPAVQGKPDVTLQGNGIFLEHFSDITPIPGVPTTITVPFRESAWRRADGQPSTREHLLMALADTSLFMIRATYADRMTESSISNIHMDIAVPYPTGQERAAEVEDCACPPGYRGPSCQDCDVGYMRTGSGLYLGTCERCNCNGHSSECDLETGECQPNVVGTLCDECKTGFFHLKQDNPDGCLQCFCMGVTKQCASSSWNREQVRAADNGQEFTLSNSANTRTISEGIILQSSSELTFRSFSEHPTDVYYWVLPERFRGDKVTSYGGELQYTVLYNPRPGSPAVQGKPDVTLQGNGIFLEHFSDITPIPGVPTTITVPFRESAWRRADGQPSTREHLLMALADTSLFMIRATYADRMTESSISNIHMDIAVPYPTGQERAAEVEDCACPPGYRGPSCQDCDVGYMRTGSGLYLGTCERCNCNGHSSECDLETGECQQCQHNTAGPHCEICKPGFYGDPKDGSPEACRPCPCPGTSPSTQFSLTCFLDTDGQPTCDNCPASYAGRRCERRMTMLEDNGIEMKDNLKAVKIKQDYLSSQLKTLTEMLSSSKKQDKIAELQKSHADLDERLSKLESKFEILIDGFTVLAEEISDLKRARSSRRNDWSHISARPFISAVPVTTPSTTKPIMKTTKLTTQSHKRLTVTKVQITLSRITTVAPLGPLRTTTKAATILPPKKLHNNYKPNITAMTMLEDNGIEMKDNLKAVKIKQDYLSSQLKTLTEMLSSSKKQDKIAELQKSHADLDERLSKLESKFEILIDGFTVLAEEISDLKRARSSRRNDWSHISARPFISAVPVTTPSTTKPIMKTTKLTTQSHKRLTVTKVQITLSRITTVAPLGPLRTTTKAATILPPKKLHNNYKPNITAKPKSEQQIVPPTTKAKTVTKVPQKLSTTRPKSPPKPLVTQRRIHNISKKTVNPTVATKPITKKRQVIKTTLVVTKPPVLKKPFTKASRQRSAWSRETGEDYSTVRPLPSPPVKRKVKHGLPTTGTVKRTISKNRLNSNGNGHTGKHPSTKKKKQPKQNSNAVDLLKLLQGLQSPKKRQQKQPSLHILLGRLAIPVKIIPDY
ncbi:UNVERIFIED_CONTAM: hypothetical protein FKN15_057920 [Acipenser sinensis]